MSDPDSNPITADPTLIMLSAVVEKGGASALPVTLAIGGQIVAGHLIASSTWQELLAQSVAQPARTEGSEADVWQLVGRVFSQAAPHERRRGNWLHLSNATIYQGGVVLNLDAVGGLLRVQTAAVGAWGLGVPSAIADGGSSPRG